MIRVTVDIVPYGNEEQSKKIGELVLANVASVGMGTCIYDAVYKTENRDPVHVGSVRHARQHGFWPLIAAILNAEPDDTDKAIFKRLEDKLWL